MEFVGSVLTLFGFFGFVVFFIVFIIMVILKKQKAPFAISMAACFAFMVLGLVLVGASSNEASPNSEKPPQKENTKAVQSDSSTADEKNTAQSNAHTKNEEGWEITYQSCDLYEDILGEMSFDAIVEVENTGTVDLYLDDAAFDFEDTDGNLLATYSSMISSDPEIIAPGEKGYFYCNSATLRGDIEEDTDYVFTPSLKIERSKHNIIRYPITDLAISEGGFMSPVDIIGRIENNTDEDEGMVWIACILFREDGSPIAACGTTVMDLKAGEKTSFELAGIYLNDTIKLSDVADYKVYACKTQYQF